MTVTDYDALAATVAAKVDANSGVADKCKEHLRLSLTWANLHHQNDRYKHCELLLQGSYGTAVEAVSLLSFGLVRPAVLSLRAHYELSLQFLFYKDHPVEWKSVISFRNQANLPGANKKYLKDFYSDFDARHKSLLAFKTRENDDCYGVLSGIAHGTAIHSIALATKPQELVENDHIVASAKAVFSDVAESISDINVACFDGNWLSLPDLVRADLTSRFVGKTPASVLKI